MIEITEAGCQLAADTVTITREAWDFLRGEGSLEGVWFSDPHPTKLGAYWWRTAIRTGHIVEMPDATQSIADKAHTEAIEAQLAEAKADLAEIAKLTKGNCTVAAGAQAFQIAAKHRVETDPLLEAVNAARFAYSDKMIADLRAELAKRGIELAVKS